MLQGHSRSASSQRPEDASGAPLPWFTYPSIEFISKLDLKNALIFEYGSGQSTLFWANKGARIWSVESSHDWYETTQKNIDNKRLPVHLTYAASESDYVSAVRHPGMKFDIIVIDGVFRLSCAETGIECIKDDGFFILDDADRDRDVANFLTNEGYFEFPFSGFGPICGFTWTTSIFIPFKASIGKQCFRPNPIGGL